jgi:NADH-quinone oxidoreductase subunit L
MTPPIVQYLWLIPGVPLAAALLIVGIGTAKRRLASGLAIFSMAISLVVSLTAFVTTLHQAPGWKGAFNFTWFVFGDQAIRIGWLLDPLSAAMVVMVTLVGLCIFVFSTGYMAEDKEYGRFFAYLSFFSAAMLGLIIANSLLSLFVCWELVGLASYLLIGFWIHKPSAAAAAKKAFITTRIGDIGFFLGILWLYRDAGTLLFYDNGQGCLEPLALAAVGAASTAVALLIFCGAAGKSGQFPLHVWLPDAMEGPTPVSALIHAATMVAAGVFLVARMYPLFSLGAVNGVTPSLTVVVWIGVLTSLMASVIAIAQDDIKRILAYSTVSQLGLMMVSLGVGGVAAGIMHLLAHGFFKALLFLGSGSVIHGCHHEQDIRGMGGLKKRMPVTFFTYAIGMLALSGFPLLFCGAWTKEGVLEHTAHWPVSHLPHYLLLLGVVLTALYMTRQMILVFFGQPREHASAHAHESPAVMTFPLILLAACSILFSVVLTPAWPWLESYINGEVAHLDLAHLFELTVFISLVLVSAGIGLGVWIYRRAGAADPLQQNQPALFRLLENKFWIDELYQKTVLAWSATAGRVSDWLDRNVWDGLVRLVAGVSQCLAQNTANFDEGGINTGFDQGCETASNIGQMLSHWHSGQIQTYLRAAGLGMLALLLIYLWLA